MPAVVYVGTITVFQTVLDLSDVSTMLKLSDMGTKREFHSMLDI